MSSDRKLPDDLIQLVNMLGYTDLNLLRDLCDTKIVELSGTDGYHYDLLRNTMHRRYSTMQVDAIKTWAHLKDPSRARFIKAFARAGKYFQKIGLRLSSHQTCELILDLVARSDQLDQHKLKFTELMSAMDNVDELFNKSFPGYANSPHAIEVLNTALANERS